MGRLKGAGGRRGEGEEGSLLCESKTHHLHNRAKDLLLSNSHLVRDVGENSRLDVVTLATLPVAAEETLGTLGLLNHHAQPPESDSYKQSLQLFFANRKPHTHTHTHLHTRRGRRRERERTGKERATAGLKLQATAAVFG